MATIKTVKYVCPNCKRKARLLGVPQHKRKFYACRLRACRCGAQFWDLRIREIGLFDRDATYPRRIRLSLGWMVTYIAVIMSAIALPIMGSPEIALALLCLLPVLAVLHVASDLILYSARTRAWQREYDRSIEQLKNPAYRERANGPSIW